MEISCMTQGTQTGALYNLEDGSCPSIINTAPPCPTCSNVKFWPLSLTEQDSKMGEWAA